VHRLLYEMSWYKLYHLTSLCQELLCGFVGGEKRASGK
jgi:hypothetical protein